jgi:hypothetical protein
MCPRHSGVYHHERVLHYVHWPRGQRVADDNPNPSTDTATYTIGGSTYLESNAYAVVRANDARVHLSRHSAG